MSEFLKRRLNRRALLKGGLATGEAAFVLAVGGRKTPSSPTEQRLPEIEYRTPDQLLQDTLTTAMSLINPSFVDQTKLIEDHLPLSALSHPSSEYLSDITKIGNRFDRGNKFYQWRIGGLQPFTRMTINAQNSPTNHLIDTRVGLILPDNREYSTPELFQLFAQHFVFPPISPVWKEKPRGVHQEETYVFSKRVGDKTYRGIVSNEVGIRESTIEAIIENSGKS